jgi:hypothetical protein
VIPRTSIERASCRLRLPARPGEVMKHGPTEDGPAEPAENGFRVVAEQELMSRRFCACGARATVFVRDLRRMLRSVLCASCDRPGLARGE